MTGWHPAPFVTTIDDAATQEDAIAMNVGLRATLLVAAAILSATSAVAQQTITFASFGGAYQAAQRKALLDPIEKKLNIVIKEDTLTGIADVRAQVRANAVKWDVADLGAASCSRGTVESLFEPLDYSVISTDGIDKGMVNTDWIGVIYYSTVISWSTQKFGVNGPQTWAEFWDAKKFPGTRSLSRGASETMEIALMADGVPLDKLYPIDVERAIKSLEKIKPNVVAWWASGAQSAQLLKDGEADMVAIWNGRASAAIKDGAKAATTYNQGILNADCLVIPKGAKNAALAQKVIALMVSPDLQANIPNYIDYGPITAKAFETGKISPEAAERINSSPKNAARQIRMNFDFWRENLAKLTERMDAFLQR
jgi:putative spermidine/putrescine transport system substrate-binding protein